MFKKGFYLLLIVLIFFITGCGKSKERALNDIFNRFEKMELELFQLDLKYSKYYATLCKSEHFIKVNEANELFKKITDWQNERKKIISKYSDINFDANSTMLREFKDQNVVNELISLTKRLNNVQADVDYGFAKDPQCNEQVVPSKIPYMDPTKNKTCIIYCQDLYSLSKQISILTDKEKLIINSSYRTLMGF